MKKVFSKKRYNVQEELKNLFLKLKKHQEKAINEIREDGILTLNYDYSQIIPIIIGCELNASYAEMYKGLNYLNGSTEKQVRVELKKFCNYETDEGYFLVNYLLGSYRRFMKEATPYIKKASNIKNAEEYEDNNEEDVTSDTLLIYGNKINSELKKEYRSSEPLHENNEKRLCINIRCCLVM